MEHGEVKTVNYSGGVVYCHVQPVRVDIEYQDVPVLNSHSGFVQVPKQGQTVTMQKLDDGTRFISDVLEKGGGYPDDMREGDLCIQLDDTTRLQFKKNNSGDYDLNIDASGDVFIDGIDFDEHTHDYNDDNGSSVNTKTTDPPQ